MATNTTIKKISATKSSKNSGGKKGEVKKKRSVHKKVLSKKPYIEFIIAFLSIPVLITVLLLNFNTLKHLGAAPTPTPSISTSNIFYAAPLSGGSVTPKATSAVQAPCEKGLGPITIDSPKEGDIVSENPVGITITYDNSMYCGAAWSYRINNGSWSGYTDSSLGLYNLPQGQVTFELRVKSIVTGDEKTLVRHFTYKGNTVLPTIAVGSSSAQ